MLPTYSEINRSIVDTMYYVHRTYDIYRLIYYIKLAEHVGIKSRQLLQYICVFIYIYIYITQVDLVHIYHYIYTGMRVRCVHSTTCIHVCTMYTMYKYIYIYIDR